jgi:hypothetical protein
MGGQIVGHAGCGAKAIYVSIGQAGDATSQVRFEKIS